MAFKHSSVNPRCDCLVRTPEGPYQYRMDTLSCPAHGDPDTIFRGGWYRDRKGRTYVRLFPDLWDDFARTWSVLPRRAAFGVVAGKTVRALIERERHRDVCPGLRECESHPAPQVWKDGRVWNLGTGWEVIEYNTFSEAMDAAGNYGRKRK